jgi:hypothetical protein
MRGAGSDGRKNKARERVPGLGVSSTGGEGGEGPTPVRSSYSPAPGASIVRAPILASSFHLRLSQVRYIGSVQEATALRKAPLSVAVR